MQVNRYYIMRLMGVFLIGFMAPVFSWAQIGGEHTYSFLELSAPARHAALGEQMLAVRDADPNTFYHNPAMLNEKMHHRVGVSSVLFPGGINYGLVSAAHHDDTLGTFGAAIQYAHYGKFLQAQPNGIQQSKFYAGETALQMGWGRADGRLSYGANLKLIGSFLETYYSLGAAVDLAASYHNPDKLFVITGVIRNIGGPIKNYRTGVKGRLPFEVELGFSKELKHVPVRFFVSAQHVERFSLTREQKQTTSTLGGDTTQRPSWIARTADKVFQHFIFGTEISIGDHVKLRGGYNYLRRKEMKLDKRQALVGFSFGAALRFSHLQIGYGRSLYHLAGGTNHITLRLDPEQLFDR